MNKILIKGLNISVMAVLLSSCVEVLDRAPDGKLSMDELWSDPLKTEQMLNRCYNQIPEKGYVYFFFDPLVVAASDDGWSSDDAAGQAIDQQYKGNASASYCPMVDYGQSYDHPQDRAYWDHFWAQIRLCSQFIENIDKAAVTSEDLRQRMKGEAYVLRAFFYMELVKWYGRLPVLEHTMAFDADYSQLRRQSVYEVAQFIGRDCDAAIAIAQLPWRITVDNEGTRTTKALAHVLKSTAMLYAASPLHNEGQDHWEEAYQTCKASVEALKANGYELFTECTDKATYRAEDATYPGSKAAALHQLVCQNVDYSGSPRDRETIWQQRSGSVFVWHIGYIGSGEDGTYKCGTCPTQELVDAFETSDGQPVLNLANPYTDEYHLTPNYNSTNTLYDANNPYANRDPRFYITVLYHGAKFLWNNGEEKTVNTLPGGKHAPSFDQSNRNQSRTGYYHKKMVTPGACNTRQINNSNWKFYRLGQVILDLAEAAANAGHLAEAREAADEVRNRSGMPDLPASLSKEDLILRIHNERRVELAWEEARYFDMRRWKKPDEDLAMECKYPTAMVITEEGGALKYTRRNVLSVPRGGWQMRDKLLPIPLSEVSRLNPLTGVEWQNPGW